MQILNDLVINLQPPINPTQTQRQIEVDLSVIVNPGSYVITNFDIDRSAFGTVVLDKLSPNQIVVPINNDIILSDIQHDLAITYYGKPIIPNGDGVTGRVVFKGQSFAIAAAPINLNIDCCCIPSKIIIDISQYNQGLPVDLVTIGAGVSGAATITIIDNTSSDYNNDFSNDFGGDKDKQILYLLNTDFWNTYEAKDQFSYTISYKGRTATNFITIQKMLHN